MQARGQSEDQRKDSPLYQWRPEEKSPLSKSQCETILVAYGSMMSRDLEVS